MAKKKYKYPKLASIPSGKVMEGHFPERVILHCSSTPDYIRSQEGFDKYGLDHFNPDQYHYVIRRDGTIEKGCDDYKQGKHTDGYNYRSLGICLIGTRFFLPDQLVSIEDLCIRFRHEYGIPPEEWFSHSDYELGASDDCLGIDIDKLKTRLKSLFGRGNRGSLVNYTKTLENLGR